ncbi:disease resistance protein RUN1-like isoform X2 [Mercurialis annua]|uniref:disease resistance protein RUN1-like isoform X2 n=1 Tax=Mercurialis annua TaxID=3986 RepID=UPI00215E37D6|nr:disease resistance protein RUN1-like isoform X2 [Mercurialis annua]
MAASTSSSEYAYHVYLSFCSNDTGKNFSDHLYAALEQSGIHTFRCDYGIESGEINDAECQKAMQNSKICLVVFSKCYAFSVRCLEELVTMMELKETGAAVIPVFYDADPDQVWDQSGSYAEAFARHETTEETKKVEKWKALLREITNSSGMNLDQRHEAEFIQYVVEIVQDRLDQYVLLPVPSYVVGIESRVRGINLWLRNGSPDPSIAVIYGIGGVGKTTIAKTVYNLNLHRFEGSCFLANVREASKQPDGIIRLQKQLVKKFLNIKKNKIDYVDAGSVKANDAVSCKKVLIVLDDVDQPDQLEAIMGTWDSLKKGSRMIITTRHERLLDPHEIHKKFRVKELDDNESLQLFSWHAFRQNHPIEGYEEHLETVIRYCCGVPLALEAMGSYLSVKFADEWESELEKFKAIPHSKIQKNLKISYDSIQEDHYRKIFLHIACFFIGRDADYAVKILDGCEFHTKVGIDDLIDRNLLEINKDNKLMMHPLLRDMGREIIRQESPDHPGSRSRVWHHEEALTVLREKIGTEAIAGLALDLHIVMQEQEHGISCINCAKRKYYEDLISRYRENQRFLGFFTRKPAEVNLLPSFPFSNVVIDAKAFAKMRKLKLLQLNYVKVNGGFEHFPKYLVWLCWHGFPLKFIPSNLCLEDLVVLDMRYSNLKHAWYGAKVLLQLKVLNLSHSYDLVSTPDFSGLPNLESLKLKSCLNLVEVHESIGNLKKLVYLNLKDCKRLMKFPRRIIMLKSLEELILSGCSQLDKLPNELTEMESLKVLHLDGITQFTTKSQESIFWSWLALRQGIESSFALSLIPQSLERLSLADCNLSDDAVADELGYFSSLKHLNLSGNSISCLPETSNRLVELESLVLDNCKNLQSLSELPTSLRRLSAEKCTSLERIANLPNLMRSLLLNLAGCEKLVEVQGLFKLESLNDHYKVLGSKLELFHLEPEEVKVEMANVITTTSRISPPQVLRECGVYSIFIPGSEVPSWYSSRSERSSASFTASQGCKVIGLNICTEYTCNDLRNGYGDQHYLKIWNKTKDLKLTYSPTFYGIPEKDERMQWYSHIKLRDEVDGGDELNVSVILSTGYDVKQFGIHLVYEQRKDESELDSEETEDHVEMYRIGRGEFFLCNHGFLIHQALTEGGCDSLRQYSYLFEQ